MNREVEEPESDHGLPLFTILLLFTTLLTFTILPLSTVHLMHPFFQPIHPPRTCQVMAHRSIMTAAPENTLPGFQQAIDLGVEWIETDVRLTKDGRHVILHDATLDRTTDGSGRVDAATLGHIVSLDAGNWFSTSFTGASVPTLPDILDFCKNRINLYLDCKAIDIDLLIREVIDHGMENQVVVFADPVTLSRGRDLDGKVPIMPSINKQLASDDWIDLLHPEAIEVHAHHLTQDLVDDFHTKDVIVQAQTLGDRDNPAMWKRCLDLGVDWIQTDKALEVIEMIDARSN